MYQKRVERDEYFSDILYGRCVYKAIKSTWKGVEVIQAEVTNLSIIRQWCSTECLGGHLIERLEISLTIGPTTSASFHSQISKGAGALRPYSELQECRFTEAQLLSPFGNHPKVKISMLSMWNLSNSIRAKESQISVEVSRLNLSFSAGDPKNSADRLGLRSPNSHQRAAFMHVRQRAQATLAQRRRARRARRAQRRLVSHMQSLSRTRPAR